MAMKTCPQCGELNGSAATSCFRCGKSLGPARTGRKICPRCRIIYSGDRETCDECHGPVSIYDEGVGSGGDYGVETWQVVVAALVPLVGFIMGLIAYAQGERETAKTLILTALIAPLILALILVPLGCMFGAF